MGREPPSHLRRVALAGIDVYFVIGVFAGDTDNVFAVECVVLFKRFERSKAIDIDGQRLLLAVGQQESNYRFVCSFRRDHISLAGAAISDDEYGWLAVAIRELRARGQTKRARPGVALAAFLPCRDVHFVDFDRPNEIKGRRIVLWVTSISHCSWRRLVLNRGDA